MKKNRETQILNLLIQKKRLEVAELAEKCNVSQVTMRKDLDALEEKGIIHRIHGYAEISNIDDLNGRLAYHYEEKVNIAKKAAELVKDGDTIMIESGSCCALLATILSKTKQNLTIITNSAFITEQIRMQKTNTILLGGIYQKDSRCLVGPLIAEQIKNFHVKYFFIGTDGYSLNTGFTNKDQLRAQAVKDMSASCEEVIIITESEKFSNVGTIPMNLQKPVSVITDKNIDSLTKQQLTMQNIKIIESE